MSHNSSWNIIEQYHLTLSKDTEFFISATGSSIRGREGVINYIHYYGKSNYDKTAIMKVPRRSSMINSTNKKKSL